MRNRTLYLFTAAGVFAATWAMLGQATTPELRHAMLISEIQLLVSAATLIYLLKHPNKN